MQSPFVETLNMKRVAMLQVHGVTLTNSTIVTVVNMGQLLNCAILHIVAAPNTCLEMAAPSSVTVVM